MQSHQFVSIQSRFCNEYTKMKSELNRIFFFTFSVLFRTIVSCLLERETRFMETHSDIRVKRLKSKIFMATDNISILKIDSQGEHLEPVHTDLLAVSMPNKWVEYPFLTMTAYVNAIAKRSMLLLMMYNFNEIK